MNNPLLNASTGPGPQLSPWLGTSASAPNGAPGQPQITPGTGGYMAPIPIPAFDKPGNPWQGIAQSDGNYATAQAAQSQQTQSGMQTAFNNLSAQSAPYPSFPNSAGLGSGTAYSTPQSGAGPAPGFAASTGANPWSFQGEAMSRG